MKYDPILLNTRPVASKPFTGKSVSLSVLADGLAVVTFDAADSRVNLLSAETMQELSEIVNKLELGTYICMVDELGCGLRFESATPVHKRIRGAVFVSGKPDNFIAGADIKEIVKAQSQPSELAFKGCQDGKELFARISRLPFPTVAAIHGRCLGGGAELTLACSKRLASDSKLTVIGLPEVGLGVLPGWGGTVRAPKLVGFAAAAALMLNPLKPWPARKAWRKGLVSELVAEDMLFDRACQVALGSQTREYKPSFLQRATRAAGDSVAGRMIITAAAAVLVRLSMGRDFPAPGTAFAVMNATFEKGEQKAFELESAAFARLCRTNACKKSVQKFLDYQKAKKAAKSS